MAFAQRFRLASCCVGVALVATVTAPDTDAAPTLVPVPIAGGLASVDPTTLAVTAQTTDGQQLVLSAPTPTHLGSPGPVRRRGATVSWSYPDDHLSVQVAPAAGRLQLTFTSTQDGTVDWPVTATDPEATAIQVPEGEGLSVPVTDPFWNTSPDGLAGQTLTLTGNLTMPFWSTTVGRHGVSYLLPGVSGNQVTFASTGGRLDATGVHTFSARENTDTWTTPIALTSPSPVAGASDYRQWLLTHHQLTSLTEKIAANPAVGSLLGAFHAYLWGSARTSAGIADLHDLGITRMWLGYDADNNPLAAPATTEAKQDGYLVAPYDTWETGVAPYSGDAGDPTVWPAGVYPSYCIQQADGRDMPGFHNTGCELSSQAFAEPTTSYLAARTDQMVANGANSYFLDSDAAGDLYDDYSPAHPMNQQQDARNRLNRMGELSSDRHLVLGSEDAGSWANQVVAYSDGSSTPAAPGLWPLERDRSTWGAYYTPPGSASGPKFFFQPVQLPTALVTAMFDPTYRVPLYETVLHGSVISLDRWELSYYKLPNVETDRALMAMLYNMPLNFVLDGPTLSQHGPQIAAMQRFFAPLHEAAGTLAMTDFHWLTPNHNVQRTQFGNGVLTVTANFGTSTSNGVAPGCVAATLRGDHQPRVLCPGTL